MKVHTFERWSFGVLLSWEGAFIGFGKWAIILWGRL